MWRLRAILVGALVVAGTATVLAAPVERPFILWTPAEIERARRRIESEPWAKAEYERELKAQGHGQTYRNLFRYLVMGDAKAGAEEKADLLSFIGAPIDKREWSDHYLTALRYDCLHRDLTDEQRASLEDTFRVHVRNQIENDRRHYGKFNWLPNMNWPRPFSAHLLALSLADTNLIWRVAAANGGWRPYFDRYVSDGGFYNEEFGKMYSMVGEMLLWCRGLERLGMDDLGYGYVAVSNHNASMRAYLGSLLKLGLPRVATAPDRWFFPRVSMGDAKGGTSGLQHALIRDARWMGSNMNGRDHRDRIVTKMLEPMWFEIAHAKWPSDGYDWMLVQTLEPGADTYYPSLYWGLDPIRAVDVRPPLAPSGAYPERGLAVLRAEEGPDFWRGPWPALGLRLATPYAHSVPDCFALTGLFAFNEPIYANRQVSAGYAGVDPGWSNSARSHCGVLVDNAEPRTVDATRLRHAFHPAVKFVAADAAGVFADAWVCRGLFLTREYLADFTSLASDRARSYLWLIHALGCAVPDNPADWAPSRNLVGAIYDLAEERSFVADGQPWAVTASRLPAVPRSPGARVGARMTVLGAPRTVAHLALAPMSPDARDRLDYGSRTPGMPSIVVARQTDRTLFAALHEPFSGSPAFRRFERIEETRDAIAVRVTGTNANDRILFRWGDAAAQPASLSDGREAFEFADHAFVRVLPDAVEAVGDLRRMRLDLCGASPKAMRLNGAAAQARFEGGFCLYGLAKPLPPVAPPPAPAPGPALRGAVATQWHPAMVRLATGAEGRAELTFRNEGAVPVAATVRLAAPEGVSVTPAEVALALSPGQEATMPIVLKGDAAVANRLGAVRLLPPADTVLPIQAEPLRVSHGMTSEKDQIWPRQFSCTVYSPRYVTRYEYWDCTQATFLLDARGLRRFSGGARYPTLYSSAADGEGKGRPEPIKIGGFQGFRPSLRTLREGDRPVLEDAGTHPHGFRSDFEYRFGEDWLWVRYKNPGRVAFDWSERQSRRKPAPYEGPFPGRTLIVAGDGALLPEVAVSPYRGVVAGLFDRPAGYEYGAATFYPTNSLYDGTLVWQPADRPMAFTFCTESEFEPLCRTWRDRGEDRPAAP
jgi:hypothetical protein